MEDKINELESTGLELKQGSGSILAAARKQQNKSIEDIAIELNLSVTQIKTIELDQTEGLPEPTYVRGYIRAYAKLLGLEPEDVLKNYLNPNWQQTSSLNDIPRGIGNAEEVGSSFFTPSKLLVLTLLVIGIGFAWYSGMFDSLLGSANRTAVSSLSDTISQSNTDAGQEEAESNDSQNTTIDLANDAEQVSDGTATELAANSDGSESANNSEISLNQLKLMFSETSWVDIRDQNDARLAYQSYAGGEELEVSSETPMRVFIGNAAGVTVEFNNQGFDLSPHKEGLYAKFVVGE